MKPQILITDTMFILPEHEAKLKAAGFEPVRLAKVEATETELIEAIKGKVGYIIGGLEKVTPAVIEAADELKILNFTGSDWAAFIPGHEVATQKHIAISNTPGTTAYPVAEFTLTLLLTMLRRVLELGGPGKETFKTGQSLTDVSIGIVGLGSIGTQLARMLRGLGATDISYWNRTRKPELESELGLTYKTLEDVCAESDVITNHVASQAGELLGADMLVRTKEGVLFINTGAADTYNLDVLYDRIANHGARAAFDRHGGVKDERFVKLPLAQWYSTNENTAFNTAKMLKETSDMAVDSVIAVLKDNDTKSVVNL